MVIGIPKEIKEHEYRVSITPEGVRELKADGHRILVESSAGTGSGFSDNDYEEAGAALSTKDKIFSESELVVKVKEPVAEEYGLLRDGLSIFTFLHLAPEPELIDILLKKNITGFAYETLEVDGKLPLLTPMSEIAGKMAPLVAAYYLQKVHGGSGVLVTGASGVPPAKALVLGAGVVGMAAIKVAHGMGADITVINRGREKLERIDEIYGPEVRTVVSSRESIAEEVIRADILIGAVLIAGARAPVLVSKELVGRMKKGSVIVDVSVDQGGCVETTRPSTHDNPVYIVDGVIHYTVANMPGAYPRTSTLALTDRTLEFVKRISRNGIETSAEQDPIMRTALNTYKGKIVHSAVLEAI